MHNYKATVTPMNANKNASLKMTEILSILVTTEG